MKNDIIINYSIIEDIVGDIFQYKSALQIMEESLKSMKDVLENENRGESIDALVEKYDKLQNYIDSCKEELTDLYGLFAGYYEEMITYIKPTNKLVNVRVDRLDVYFNLQSIIYAIQDIRNLKYGSNYINAFATSTSDYGSSDNLQVSYGWHPNKIVNEEEKKNEEDNYQKLQEIRELIERYSRRITERGEVMEDLFNNKVVHFEETDDIYAGKVAPIYNKYTSIEEARANLKAKQDENMKKAWDAICNSFKSAFELIGGIADYTKGAEAVWEAKILGKEMTPLDNYYAEKYHKGNEILKAILEDPSIIPEGMAQQMSDDLDQKGLAYFTGSIIGDYLLFKIGKGIKVKVSNIVEVEKVFEKVSSVINKLKTKFDDIFDIVEETVDEGDSIVFKLGNGSETTISKAELRAQGISDSAIQYCIEGCFVGDTLVLTDKGFIRIDEIEVGDFVYATDVKTGDKEYKEVLQVHIRNTNEFVKLNVEGEEIITTPGHLFYTNEGMWIIAGELKPGDEILSSDGQAKKVISVKEELLEETERIYNLSIEGYSTYYISKLALLVHNMGCVKLADLIKAASEKSGKFSTNELQNLNVTLKTNQNYSNIMFRELMTGVSNDIFVLDKVTYNGRNAIKIVTTSNSTSIIIDSQGKVLEMRWIIGEQIEDRTKFTGWARSLVGAGNQKGHLKSISEGALNNCIEDSPLNVIPQTSPVNQSKIKRFEYYRRDSLQGKEVINENLANGYVRVRIPEGNIDVTYNPLSTSARDWPNDWYISENYPGRIWR
ncbi:Hint domain-containing protein [Clostridium sp. SHJSY1]|uniref:Hint domain-containing protein n=1 Tax=Clostridium sp. SHJSY1 TaxID=2942483 RepID=UPI0028744CEF|nr:Hint domain-containing protein [Clostridium sp. SHJSY1]MDS0527577.1 Hint domain-containing protein [Clostridium sp. SHJSY1]